MNKNVFESMSLEELWSLHEQVTSTLARQITAEKARLEDRLRKIQPTSKVDRVRRPYPRVLPKYRNPKNHAETWSGRGKQPHWVRAQLKAGKKLEHFLIA